MYFKECRENNETGNYLKFTMKEWVPWQFLVIIAFAYLQSTFCDTQFQLCVVCLSLSHAVMEELYIDILMAIVSLPPQHHTQLLYYVPIQNITCKQLVASVCNLPLSSDVRRHRLRPGDVSGVGVGLPLNKTF